MGDYLIMTATEARAASNKAFARKVDRNEMLGRLVEDIEAAVIEGKTATSHFTGRNACGESISIAARFLRDHGYCVEIDEIQTPFGSSIAFPVYNIKVSW